MRREERGGGGHDDTRSEHVGENRRVHETTHTGARADDRECNDDRQKQSALADAVQVCERVGKRDRTRKRKEERQHCSSYHDESREPQMDRQTVRQNAGERECHNAEGGQLCKRNAPQQAAEKRTVHRHDHHEADEAGNESG